MMCDASVEPSLTHSLTHRPPKPHRELKKHREALRIEEGREQGAGACLFLEYSRMFLEKEDLCNGSIAHVL